MGIFGEVSNRDALILPAEEILDIIADSENSSAGRMTLIQHRANKRSQGELGMDCSGFQHACEEGCRTFCSRFVRMLVACESRVRRAARVPRYLACSAVHDVFLRKKPAPVITGKGEFARSNAVRRFRHARLRYVLLSSTRRSWALVSALLILGSGLFGFGGICLPTVGATLETPRFGSTDLSTPFRTLPVPARPSSRSRLLGVAGAPGAGATAAPAAPRCARSPHLRKARAPS